MKRVQEVWERGNATAVLLMDVKGAFAYVAKGNLIKRMEEMESEADLVRWVESFMRERKVIYVDGQKGGGQYGCGNGSSAGVASVASSFCYMPLGVVRQS
jgi:hypothetical protein